MQAMKTTSHHVQFVPGTPFFPVASCAFEPNGVIDGRTGATGCVPEIRVHFNKERYDVRYLGDNCKDRVEAIAVAERMIEQALGFTGANNSAAEQNEPQSECEGGICPL